MKIGLVTSVVLASVLGAGCGGGGGGGGGTGSNAPAVPPNPTITGKVIDGYITGATVFWDCDGDWALGSGEISAQSGAGGVYSIASAPKESCVLRAGVGPGAIDEDDGSTFLRRLVFSAVPGKPVLITPLTTLVAMGAGTEAELAATLGIPQDLTKDFLSGPAADARSHNAARVAAQQLRNVSPGVFGNAAMAQPVAATVAANTALVLNRTSNAPFSNASILFQLGIDSSPYFSIALPSVPAPLTPAVDGRVGLSAQQTLLIQEILKLAVQNDAVHGNQIAFAKLRDADIAGLNPRLEGLFGNTDNVLALMTARALETEQLNKSFENALKGENKFLDIPTSITLISNATRSLYGIAEVVTGAAPASYAVGLVRVFHFGTTATGRLKSAAKTAKQLRELGAKLPKCLSVASAAADAIDQAISGRTYTDDDIVGLSDIALNLADCVSTFAKSETDLAKALSFVAADAKAAVLGDFISGVEAVKSFVDLVLFAPNFAQAVLLIDGALDYGLGILSNLKAIEELNQALAAKIQVTAERLALTFKPQIDLIIRGYRVKILAARVNPYIVSSSSACQATASVVDYICMSNASGAVTAVTAPGLAINRASSVTVTGTGLPTTIKMSLGGIDCGAATNASSSGFAATCTPGGTAGLQQVVITNASSGAIIDASRQLLVGAAAPTVVSSNFVAAAPARLEVTFTEPMNANYFTTGDYVPTSSVWESPTRFVITFASYTPGGKITLKAPTATDPRAFKSAAGVGLAQDYVFQFPGTQPPMGNAPIATNLNFVATVPPRLEVTFDQPMKEFYGTAGNYVPASSVWETSTKFVITFASFTPGELITLKADSFVSAAGQPIASDITYRFPMNSGTLLARWTFDDCTGADASGNGRQAILNGGPACVAGRSGKALRFSGIDVLDNVVPQWLELPRNPGAALTFATWFKWEPTTGYRSSGLNESIWAIGDTQSDTHSTGIWISNAATRSLYAYGTNGPAALAVPGEWMHVAFTSDGKVSKLYVNGEYAHQVIHATPINLAGQAQYISSFERQGFPSLRHVFSGSIDDVRLYGKVLSADEVRSVYRGE